MSQCILFIRQVDWPKEITFVSGAQCFQAIILNSSEKKYLEKLKNIFGHESLELPEASFLSVRRFHKGVSNPLSSSMSSVLGLGTDQIRVDHFIAFLESEDLEKAFVELNSLWREPAIESLDKMNFLEWKNSYREFPQTVSRVDDSFEAVKSVEIGLDFSEEELLSIEAESEKQGRPWNRAELELLAQTWSEHCKHKIFAAEIEAKEALQEKTDSLFKTHIQKDALKMQKERPDLYLSLFYDNAGVLRLFSPCGKPTDWALCLKMETHNSPSAIAPYGGASTGIVGVHRDILGTGKGALPVANWNVLCFETPEHNDPRPESALRPDIIRRGVIKGIEDGGNQSGIPTVQGSVVFDSNYAVKPLVYAGALGILKVKDVEKSPEVGLKLFCVGGAVGADGLRGAVMSSRDIREEDFSGSIVQVANAFVQRRVTDFLMEAQKRELIQVITDNGAGGLASSVGEMAQSTNGACIDVTHLRLKFANLLGWERLLSESQERMTVATKYPDQFVALAKEYSVGIDALGELNDSGRLVVRYQDKNLVDISLKFLHDGCPRLKLKTEWTFADEQKSIEQETQFSKKEFDLLKDFPSMLESVHLCSREGVARRFDHEVQGRTLRQSFAGKTGHSPQDGTLLNIYEAGAHFAFAHGLAPQRRDIHENVLNSFDEALRQSILAGGKMKYMAMLDNFCWSDPIKDERQLWRLVRSCEVLSQLCRDFSVPLISGKDSMKNNNQEFKVPSTLVISCGASAAGVEKIPSGFFARSNDLVYFVPPVKSTLCDSAWERSLESLAPSRERMFKSSDARGVQNELSAITSRLKDRYLRLENSIEEGLLRSAKDIGEGGLLTALFEKCLGRSLGFFFEEKKANLEELFTEGVGSFLISIDPHSIENFEKVMPEAKRLGVVIKHPEIVWSDDSKMALSDLRAKYQRLEGNDLWN